MKKVKNKLSTSFTMKVKNNRCVRREREPTLITTKKERKKEGKEGGRERSIMERPCQRRPRWGHWVDVHGKKERQESLTSGSFH